MPRETNLSILLKSMKPILRSGEYVFCSVDYQNTSYLRFNPIWIFCEDEELSLVLSRKYTDANNISYSSVFRMITCQKSLA